MQNTNLSHLCMIEDLFHADFILTEISPIKNEDAAKRTFQDNLKIDILVAGRKNIIYV